MAEFRASPRRWALLLVFLGFLGCENRDEWVCEVEDPRGPLIQIRASEMDEVEQWTAVELWHAGGLEEGGAQLTTPTSARVRSDGTLAIADFGSGDVWLLDREGRWLDPVAGRGQGPGELLNPLATAWTPSGGLLALDAAQSKLELYDIDSGQPETLGIPSDLLGPIFTAGEVGWFAMRGDGSVFVELPASASESGSVTYARAAPGDAQRSLIWEGEYPADLVPSNVSYVPAEWPRALLAVGMDRWAVAPRSDRYELIVHGPADEATVHICVSDRDAFGYREGSDEFERSDVMVRADDLPRPEAQPLFSRLQMDHDGRLWVERELPRVHSAPDVRYGVAGAHLDVLSPDGTLLARMRLPEGLRFQEARGDTIWAFRIGEFDEVQVVAARITRVAR